MRRHIVYIDAHEEWYVDESDLQKVRAVLDDVGVPVEDEDEEDLDDDEDLDVDEDEDVEEDEEDAIASRKRGA